MRSSHTFDPRRGTALRWLYGVASRQLANGARERARRVRAELRLAGQRLIEPDDLERIERQIDASAMARQLHRAMAALPPGEREVVELVVREALTPAQAAAALGIRPVTARVRLLKARRKLRAITLPARTGIGDDPKPWDTSYRSAPHPELLGPEALAFLRQQGWTLLAQDTDGMGRDEVLRIRKDLLRTKRLSFTVCQ
jgi:RNA polymerase sigma factor (sigma-70 family)